MKTFPNLLFVLLFANLTACNQADINATTKPKINISSTLEDKVYDNGESCQVNLSITERYAEDDYFYLHITKLQGEAELISDNEAIKLDENIKINHTIYSTVLSTKNILLFITPTTNKLSSQTIKFLITASSANGKITSTHEVRVSTHNNNPIDISAKYSYEPIIVSDKFDIELDITKKGFSGAYYLSILQIEGVGSCMIENDIITNDSVRIDYNKNPFLLQYQPTEPGCHVMEITITDGESTKRKLRLKCEVYRDYVHPEKDGAFIYAKNYNSSPFVTLEEWESFNGKIQAEGIAIIKKSVGLSVLLPLHDHPRAYFCEYSDDLLMIPGYDYANTDNGKVNTEKIYAAYKAGIISSAPMVEACYFYEPQSPGRWYLPSSKEIEEMAKDWDQKMNMMVYAIRGSLYLSRGAGPYATSSIIYSETLAGHGFIESHKRLNTVYQHPFFAIRHIL